MSASPKRFLGIELSGAKNQKTAACVLEFYPREGKTFVLDVYDKIITDEGETSDDGLLALLQELGSDKAIQAVGVNVPLDLPPCLVCRRRACFEGPCDDPGVRWAQTLLKKYDRASRGPGRARQFTPYTQRPIEVWIWHEIIEKLPAYLRFELDETMGGNRAPLTARMHFLQKKLPTFHFVEVLPKLIVARLAEAGIVPKRDALAFRKIEEGAEARENLLHAIAQKLNFFVYDRDIHKLSLSLTSFDAFLCAMSCALTEARGSRHKPARGWPRGQRLVDDPRV